MAKKLTKKDSAAGQSVVDEAVARGRARVEETRRPAAVGAPGTVVDPSLPPSSADDFIAALVKDAESAGCNYSVVVRDESDASQAALLTRLSDRLVSVRVNPTLEVRGTWRKRR